MTITNHVLVGSIIGITAKEPTLALSLAFASHFVMDALPHFGYEGNKGYGEALKHRLSYQVGIISALTTTGVIAFLIINAQWLALVTGLVAASPDLVGIYNYRKYERFGTEASQFIKLFHIKFHRTIQQYERPWGIYIELAVFLLFSVVLYTLVK